MHRNHFLLASTTLTLLLVMLPLAGLAQTAAERVAEAAFTAAEREIITSYFHEHGDRYRQSGRGRDGGLPPGIARNLARGKPLPPGIARQFPDPLAARLPPPPRGYERVYVDGRVLLVESGTQIVHDMLSDLLL